MVSLEIWFFVPFVETMGDGKKRCENGECEENRESIKRRNKEKGKKVYGAPVTKKLVVQVILYVLLMSYISK